MESKGRANGWFPRFAAMSHSNTSTGTPSRPRWWLAATSHQRDGVFLELPIIATAAVGVWFGHGFGVCRSKALSTQSRTAHFREQEQEQDKEKEFHRNQTDPSPIRDLVMKQLAENSVQLRSASFQFDEWLHLVGDDQIYEAGRNTNFPLHPAHCWTHIAGRQAVDFIGRVENFEADFQNFLEHVGIGTLPPVNSNVVELEGGAAGNPHGYRYVDRMHARSIGKINRLFERDFEIFGYKRLG